MAPIAFLIGVPWCDTFQVDQLGGVKVVLNAFVACLVAWQQNLSAKLEMIATYALCGFTNPGGGSGFQSAKSTPWFRGKGRTWQSWDSDQR